MNMSLMPFNTYDYVEELIQGGFSKQQAEANMRALVKTLDFTIEHKLATKDELKEVVYRLEEIEKNYVTKKEIQEVEHRLDNKIDRLDHKIDKIFLKTVVTTGICTGTMLTIACSLMTFLIKF